MKACPDPKAPIAIGGIRGISSGTWEDVRHKKIFDPAYFRPKEVDLLIGDPSKSNKELGWKLNYNLKSLVNEMFNAEVVFYKKDIYLIMSGHKVLLQQE